MSERQREACRRNGQKGAHAWLRMLRDGFMLPAETLQRVWEGLVKAVLWHLTDCSARYASRFREGIYAISLVRSLAAAGEKAEDYARHVRQLVRAFTESEQIVDRSSWIVASDSDDLSPSEQIVDRGSSIAASDNEDLSASEQIVDRGSSIVASRTESPQTSPAAVDGLRSTNNDPRSTVNEARSTNDDPRSTHSKSIVSTLSTSLAQVSWRRLRASRGHARWEWQSVVRLFREVAAERERGQAVTGERLTWLAEDVHKILFFSAERFQLKVRRLNRRFEALAARLLDELGLPPMDVHVRPSPAVESATSSTLAAALGNPAQSPSRVRAAQKPRKPRVKALKDWDHRQGKWDMKSGRLPSDDAQNCRLPIADRRLEGAEDNPQSSVDNQQAGEPATNNREPATVNRQSSIDDRQVFFALVAQALGPNPSLKSGQTDAVPGGLATALWNRLELSRRQGEDERELFSAMLAEYMDSLDNDRLAVAGERLPLSRDSQIPDSEFNTTAEEQAGIRQSHRQPATANQQPSAGLTELSTTLATLFRADDEDARIEAELLNFRAQVWIYLMLLGREAPREEIVLLQPGPPSDCGTVARAMKFYNARSELRQAECQRLLLKADRLAAEWKRWENVIESGDIGRLRPEEPDESWEALVLASNLTSVKAS